MPCRYEREFFGAKVIFDTAFGQAKNSDFDTFQVDTHFARYLLESRMLATDQFPDAFWAFTEAHKHLRAQILKEKNATHPYRVAQLYPQFVEALWDTFDARQRTAIRRLVVEMQSFLTKAPARYSAQKKFAETKEQLAEWLERHT